MEGPSKSKNEETTDALFRKFSENNPLMTRKDFEELRMLALKAVQPGARKFYMENGVVMSEEIDSDNERR